MYKTLVFYGVAVCLGTIATVSAGTLKAAAAEAISDLGVSKFEARGGKPPQHHGGHDGQDEDDDGHHGGGGSGGWGAVAGSGWGGAGGGSGWGGAGGGHGGGWGGLGLGGGHGSSPLHGNESFGGPTVIALAFPIAVGLIIALWIAAYNTLRSPPPKVGYNAGIVESAGWGGNQAATYISGGYGYPDAAGSDPHAAQASNLAATQIVTAAATQGAAGAVAAGRALDNLTHRVTRSIESLQRKY